MYRLLALLVLPLVFTTCASLNSTAPASAPEKASVRDLKSAMTGSFSSELQAMANDAYYNIVLHMAPIWPDQPGDYLYVEQAVADTPTEPYRQRVYALERKGGNRFVSRVYELPEPKQFIGAHEDPSRLSVISPADLIEREGCAVYLRRDKSGVYRGQTKKDKCKSTLRGATYATSRVSIAPGNFVQSWDRGFDAEGKQVWGAEEGGYMFLKE